jgi:hypothetical protein
MAATRHPADLLGGVERLLVTSSSTLADSGHHSHAARAARWATWVRMWRLDDEAGACMRLLMQRMLVAPPGRELLQLALMDAIAILEADFGNLQLAHTDGSLRIAAQAGFDPDFLEYFAVVRDEHSACGRAAHEARQIVIADVRADEGFAPHRAIAAATGFRAVQSTPIVDLDGALLGMISTHFRHPHHPSERDLEIVAWQAHQLGRLLVS